MKGREMEKLKTYLAHATFERLRVRSKQVFPVGGRHPTCIVQVTLCDHKFTHRMLEEMLLLMAAVRDFWKNEPYPLYLVWNLNRSMGGDLRFFNDCLQSPVDEARRRLMEYAALCIACVFRNATLCREAPVVSISLIRNAALGGGLEAALSSPLVYADTPDTRMGFTEARLGMFPGMGGPLLALARAQSPEAHKLVHHMVEKGVICRADMLAKQGIISGVLPQQKLLARITDYGEEYHNDLLIAVRQEKMPTTIRMRNLRTGVREWVEHVLSLPKKNRGRIRALGMLQK